MTSLKPITPIYNTEIDEEAIYDESHEGDKRMNGKVLELRSEKDMRIGEDIGRRIALYELVRDGLISVKDASAKLGISVAEFETMMKFGKAASEVAYREAAAKRDEEMIQDMLQRGKTESEIHNFCGYVVEVIQKVKQEMIAEGKADV